MKTLSLKKAEFDDVELQELLSKLYGSLTVRMKRVPEFYSSITEEDLIECCSVNPDCEFYYIMLNDIIIGCCGFSEFDLFRNTLFFSSFFINDSYRGRGFGRYTFELIKKLAKKEGYTKIFLNVLHGNPAEKLYKKIGFKDLEKVLFLNI